MTILLVILGFLIGLVVSNHYIVVPLWETEKGLRKELKKLRGELWCKSLAAANLRTWVQMHLPVFTPESRTVPHRAHSDVLPFDSIDDLIRGTK